MLSTSSIALSGMRAAQTSLQAGAHNIANLNTEGFRREQVANESMPSGGVAATVSQLPNVGNAMETDLVGQLQAKNAFLANLAVFRAHDSLMGSLLDTRS